ALPISIYPVLREFEQGGYVTSTAETVSGRERKVYALTDKGRTAFKVAVEAWSDVTCCLTESGKLACAEDDGSACRP
ncbi:MAG: PadR family transcriptional regulator, partial [Sneathiellaceae bacterium]